MYTERVIAQHLPPQFQDNSPVFLGRAPGRLDVMGGISDYSGGTCLEWPLEVGTTCKLQLTSEQDFHCYSHTAREEGWPAHIMVSGVDLANLDYAAARQYFEGPGNWTRYVLGCFVVLRQELGFMAPGGALMEITSTVPTGAGVSSSAALEVACLAAINQAYGLDLCGHKVALLAQKVENHVAGAPCGLMDQLTVALGQKGHLLRLKCQPDIVEGLLQVPQGVLFYGVDSGVKHSVAGSAYARARTGAFMGRKIVSQWVEQVLLGPDGNRYLANLGSDVWRALRLQVPEHLTGQDFTAQYGSHEDVVTEVEPTHSYPVRLATEHPVYEADRVKRFAHLLARAASNPGARFALLSAAGDLMVQSHFSYDHRCQLGCAETDLIVELARKAGPSQGIYGAKITGGGAGGTVAILADSQVNPQVQDLVDSIVVEYQSQTGHLPTLFCGSSSGALAGIA